MLPMVRRDRVLSKEKLELQVVAGKNDRNWYGNELEREKDDENIFKSLQEMIREQKGTCAKKKVLMMKISDFKNE